MSFREFAELSVRESADLSFREFAELSCMSSPSPRELPPCERRTVISASIRSVRISEKRAARSGSAEAPSSSHNLPLAPSIVNFLSYRRWRNLNRRRISFPVYSRLPERLFLGESKGSSLSQ